MTTTDTVLLVFLIVSVLGMLACLLTGVFGLPKKPTQLETAQDPLDCPECDPPKMLVGYKFLLGIPLFLALIVDIIFGVGGLVLISLSGELRNLNIGDYLSITIILSGVINLCGLALIIEWPHLLTRSAKTLATICIAGSSIRLFLWSLLIVLPLLLAFTQ